MYRAVWVATNYWLDSPGLESQQLQQEISFPPKLSRTVRGPSQPPIKWVTVFIPGRKAAGK
jgi:hypothetical protein